MSCVSDRDGDSVTLRSLTGSVFAPTIVYALGNGAVTPIIALTALDLGASPAIAGAVVALLGLGQLVGNVPSAAMVNRLGDRWAMILSAALSGFAMVASYFAPHLIVLAVATLVAGACNATFGLARQSFVTVVVPASHRAAALSTLGGSNRIGALIGPFVGAGVIHLTNQRAAYLVAVAAAIATVAVLSVVGEPPQAETFAQRPRETASALAIWRTHGRLLATLGLAIFAVGGVRAARSTVLPLWAAHLGLDAQTTSIVFGVGMAVEVALFYPAGRIMDRYGRLAVALPCLLLLGGSMMLLPLTGGVVSLTAVAMAMSLGNGLGSGIVMTLGADVAPPAAPVRFLSQWRLVGDGGSSAGPLLVAFIAVWSVAGGIVAAGALGLLAAAGIARWAPRYSPYARRGAKAGTSGRSPRPPAVPGRGAGSTRGRRRRPGTAVTSPPPDRVSPARRG